jgi:hypothetical protein
MPIEELPWRPWHERSRSFEVPDFGTIHVVIINRNRRRQSVAGLVDQAHAECIEYELDPARPKYVTCVQARIQDCPRCGAPGGGAVQFEKFDSCSLDEAVTHFDRIVREALEYTSEPQ